MQYSSQLIKFLCNPLENIKSWHDGDAVERVFYIFRCFFAFKLFLNLFPFALLFRAYERDSGNIFPIFQSWIDDPYYLLLILALFLACTRNLYGVGLLVLAYNHFQYKVYNTLPFTINHVALELIILTIMILLSSHHYGSQNARKLNLLCVRLIQYLFVSVYVYSGIHKLTNGYYVNGEMFALITFNRSQTMSTPILSLLIPYLSVHEADIPWVQACCQSGQLEYRSGVAIWFIGLSWLVMLGEILIPLLTLSRHTRLYGALGLVLMQISIAVISLELDFACTAMAIILLFFPKRAKINYSILLLFTIYINAAGSAWLTQWIESLIGVQK